MSASETCSVCGQEVRWGTRKDPVTKIPRTMYLHREEVDHMPVFGNMTRPQPVAEDTESAEDESIPEPEIPCHPIEVEDLPPRSGTRQIANLVAREGWELRSLTHVRGPYVGAGGKVLSISDVVVLRARRPPELDGSMPIAVGSWRDGKYDFAYVGVVKDGRLSPRKVDATTLKNFIKGIE